MKNKHFGVLASWMLGSLLLVSSCEKMVISIDIDTTWDEEAIEFNFR